MSEEDVTPTGSERAFREILYADAQKWSLDREAGDVRSTRTAWIMASIATGIAVMEALALIGLVPLKTVVPYTLLVDATSGSVQALDGAGAPPIRPDAALIQSLLTQYVIARETFDIDSIGEQYRKVSLWSADKARADYLAVMPADNPDSPLHRYARSTLVTTSIESVSPIAPNAAMVRFATERRDQNQGAPQTDYWVAVLRYRFSGQPMEMADRLVNPLGFQVVEYRRDQEAAPPQSNAGTRPPLLPEPGAMAPNAMQATPGGSMPFPQSGVGQPPIYSAPFGGGVIPGPIGPRQPMRMPAPATPPQDDL